MWYGMLSIQACTDHMSSSFKTSFFFREPLFLSLLLNVEWGRKARRGGIAHETAAAAGNGGAIRINFSKPVGTRRKQNKDEL
jgi:hypothetical protein